MHRHQYHYHQKPDVDECKNNELNECDTNALCTNTEGFYICRCLKGFEGDGRFCAGKVIILFTYYHIIHMHITL